MNIYISRTKDVLLGVNLHVSRSLHENRYLLCSSFLSGLKDLVADAYFVIVPSEWYENNPMTIIEAYSAGTPVIGARIDGIPEIVVEGETGYLFESGNSKGLREVVVKANSLSAENYVNYSVGAIKFAHDKLILDNFYPRLSAFYESFLTKRIK